MSSRGAESDAGKPIRLLIGATESGQRLDRILAERDLGESRATLQRWIEQGRVLVDGRPARRNTRPTVGARVELRPAPPPPSSAVAQDIALDILYEDEALIVLNKPAGLVVHPAAGHPDGTLVNALLHHTRLADAGDPMRPGIVHRLDRDTSGVMVVAKQAKAREGLIALFKEHDIERAYLGIALGHPPDAETHDTLHGRHPRDRKRFSSRVDQGKRAVTHVRALRRLHAATLVECTLETGRTHQIRVHLADAGHPLLGDPAYGRSVRDPRLQEVVTILGRPALHARLLGFRHPLSGQQLRFEQPLPDDFERALQALQSA